MPLWGKYKRFNIGMIAFSAILLFISSATSVYAYITNQVVTSSEKININGIGTVTAAVTLTSGNVFLADSSGNKTTTQAKLYPAGHFAVPISVSYTSDVRDSGYQKVALKTGASSLTVSSMAVICLDNGNGGAGTNATQFNKYFSTFQLKCSTATNANVITQGTTNNDYYIYLATKNPADTSASNQTPANYFTNSITSLTVTFSLTAYTVD